MEWKVTADQFKKTWMQMGRVRDEENVYNLYFRGKCHCVCLTNSLHQFKKFELHKREPTGALITWIATT